MAQQREIFIAGAAKNGLSKRQGRRALRPDGEVRRLRLQQVARRRLRAGRLPDGVHEGAPRRRVHGGQLVGGDGRHRQGAAVLRRRAWPTASPCCRPTSTPREYRFVPLDRKTVRYGLGAVKGTGESAIAAIDRGAQGRAVQGPLRFLPPRRQAHRQPARGRGAGARRRLRRARRQPRAACSPRVGARIEGAEQAERAASQVSLFGEAEVPRGGASAYVDGRALGPDAAAAGGEDRARLLPLGPPVQRLRARAARLPAHAARQARAVALPGHCSPASSPRRAPR